MLSPHVHCMSIYQRMESARTFNWKDCSSLRTSMMVDSLQGKCYLHCTCSPVVHIFSSCDQFNVFNSAVFVQEVVKVNVVFHVF